VAVALAVAFGTGGIEREARYLLAFGGIIIGGTMTVSTLAGRRLMISAHEKWEQVEGWMAIGASPRQSTLAIARESVGEALVPTIDQTRTTGLVTLPGTFVGAIMGGASPIDAGRFQIMVLAAVLAAGSIAATLLVTALGPMKERPERP
jgi:putative ABC transport system permease protein